MGEQPAVSAAAATALRAPRKFKRLVMGRLDSCSRGRLFEQRQHPHGGDQHVGIVQSELVQADALQHTARVEAGIHSIVEVASGAVLGTGVAIIIFQLWG